MWTHNTLCLIIPASTLVLSLVEILKSAGLANACSLGQLKIVAAAALLLSKNDPRSNLRASNF